MSNTGKISLLDEQATASPEETTPRELVDENLSSSGTLHLFPFFAGLEAKPEVLRTQTRPRGEGLFRPFPANEV